MFVAVMVRQKRWVEKWMDSSTLPLPFPRRCGQATTLAPCLATGTKLGWTIPVLGSTTVAMRSKRKRRALPPRRRSTPSMASIRWAWSLDSAKTPRNVPEHGKDPTSGWASPPQGASGSSSQFHWISAPGRVLDLDRGPALDAVARLAVRAQLVGAGKPRVKR
jgi:hypothetical protein